MPYVKVLFTVSYNLTTGLKDFRFLSSKKTKVVACDFSSNGSFLLLHQLCTCVSESAVICVITEGSRAPQRTELNNSTHPRLLRTEEKFSLKKKSGQPKFRGF